MSDEKLAEQLAIERSQKQNSTGQKDLDAAIQWHIKVGFEDGFLAGLKAERERSRKLVECLKHITTCVERSDEHETANISNYHRLKDARCTAERAVQEYEKESE